jgi:hypothetical protein
VPRSPKLPTRVIDVGTANTEIKLVESAGRSGNYLTLSHCLGDTHYRSYQTRKSSLRENGRGIPWPAFSKTFQDAVLITRQLGYRFLWIDSICIVQGNTQGCEAELAQIAEVYSYYDLNLAAAVPSDGRGGCMIPRYRSPTKTSMVDKPDRISQESPSHLLGSACRAITVQTEGSPCG